jgi:D-alanyl-lipoteichoic acid acyltransferase DltB (MBOAT superfamily)
VEPQGRRGVADARVVLLLRLVEPEVHRAARVLHRVVNFGIGTSIQRLSGAGRSRRAKGMLFFGVAFNLVLLGYFKYANFFVDNLNHALDTSLTLAEIVLRLGISFYTFTQIAYLANAAQGKVREQWRPGLVFCLHSWLPAFPTTTGHRPTVPAGILRSRYGALP